VGPLAFPITVLALLPALATVRVTDTVNLGTVVLGIVLSIATLIGVIYGVKYKVAAEVENKAREAAEAFGDIKDAESKTLHNQLIEAKDLITQQAVIIERLEQLPNLERIVHLMGEQSVRADAAAAQRLEHGLKEITKTFSSIIGEHDKEVEERLSKVIEAILELKEGRA